MIPRYSRPDMEKVWSDGNMFDIWLNVEKAATVAWAELGVIPATDVEKIKRASFDREIYDRIFDETKHDVVSFTRAISEKLGSESRWIHHGLTSNDVKDTALGVQLGQACDLIDQEIDQLMIALETRARELKNTLCIGRSHGIHAEPMSFGLKLALWWDEFSRHKERLSPIRERVSKCMISGPVGTYSSVPPEIEISVARQMGLTPVRISNQIIQRDRHAEYLQIIALIGSTLEKIATEIRSLQRTEIGEVMEPFGTTGYVTKGSSSMPHKRNPELSERVCGLARVVRSNSIVGLDNIALWHERDISHSSSERIVLPDSSLALDYMLNTMTGIIQGMSVFSDRMMENLEMTKGLVFSPRVMLALVEAGMDRKQSYDLIQEHSINSWKRNQDFRKLIKKDEIVVKFIGEKGIVDLFDYGYYIRHVDYSFKRIGFSSDGAN